MLEQRHKHSAPQHWDAPWCDVGHVVLPGDCGTEPPWLGKEWSLLSPAQQEPPLSSLPAQSSIAAWGEERGRCEERGQTLIYLWGAFLTCSAVLKAHVAYWITSVTSRPLCFVSREHRSLMQSGIACCGWVPAFCSQQYPMETLLVFHSI